MNISFVYRKFQKSIAGFAILALLTSFASFVGVAQASFPDVDADHWASSFIDELVSQGVVSGYADGTFGPDDTLTRGQLAKIAVLAFLGESEVDESYDAGFTDVDGHWAAAYINTASKHGIVSGYTDANGDPTGEFGPDNTVNRAEAAKILIGAAGLTVDTTGGPHFPDVDEGAWYYDYVETAYNNSIVSGYSNGSFGPGDPVTRAQAAKMTVGAQNPVPVSTGDDTTGDDTTSSGDGVLSVSTLSLSGGTVPKAATAVPMLGLELKASGADMKLSSLVVTRAGVGSTSDFSNVYFFEGDGRIGSGHSISSDSNTATFNGLNVSVDKDETKWVWIKADYSSTATVSDQSYFSVASASAMTVTGGTVSGSFPLVGPTFSVGGATAGTVTISKNSTVSNPTIGETDAEIADFKLEAANEDMTLETLAVIIKGTVNSSALDNFKLIQNGEVLATASSANSDDLVTFVLDTPFELAKGDTRTFSITAEVTGSVRAADTVQVYLDENTDLVAIGSVYGFGAAVTSTAYDNSVADGTEANWSTVQGGTFTVAFNGPSVFNFAPNSKNLGFLDLTFTSGRDVEVRQLGFTIAATGSGLIDADGATANYTDIKLVNSDTGATLMGPSELTVAGSDSSQTITFTNSWYLDAGESINASLQMDIANEATLDDTPSVVTVTMAAISTTAGVKDTGTGEYLTDLVPAGTIAGYGHTAQAASLAVALASDPVSDTIVKGTSKATLAGFVFSAGDASDVTITKISPTVAFSLHDTGAAGTWSVSGSTGSTTYAKTLVQTLYLYDVDGVMIGTAKAVPNAGKPTFDGLSLVVPAGGSIVVYVKGDIATTAPSEGSADLVGIDIEATGDITAQDVDSNSVTLTAANPNGATGANATTVAMTLTAAGSIVVSSPTSQVSDQLVAAGSTDVLIGRVKVKATDEDFKVKKIRLDASAANSDNFKKVTIKYPTSLSTPTTLDGTSTVTFSGTAVTFSNLNFMVPAANDNVTFEIYAEVNPHTDDSGAADSGDALAMSLYAYPASFEAVGQGSGTTKDGDDSGVISATVSTNNPYVFKTVPTVTVDTLAQSFVPGPASEVFRFKLKAAPQGDLALLGLRFDVSSSGILTGSTGLGGAMSNLRGGGTANAWKMYELGNDSVQVGSGEYVFYGYAGGTASDSVYMDVYDNTTNWYAGSGSFETISAGQEKTYVVKANVVDDGTVNTNAISVRITSDTSALFAQTQAATAGTPLASPLGSAGFIWADRPNETSFATGAAYWNNGYKVVGLPTSYVTSS